MCAEYLINIRKIVEFLMDSRVDGAKGSRSLAEGVGVVVHQSVTTRPELKPT
jgi:hypothetical protein